MTEKELSKKYPQAIKMCGSEHIKCTELKPCPFCGSKAEVHREPPKGVGVSCFKPYIECGCGLTLQKNSFTELIEAWNRRAETHKSKPKKVKSDAPYTPYVDFGFGGEI